MSLTLTLLGDLCLSGHAPVLDEWLRQALDGSDFVVPNIEGAILPKGPPRAESSRVGIHNAAGAASFLARLGARHVVLANNHMFDYGGGLASTRTLLGEAGIASCGAGTSIAEAAAPLRLESDGGCAYLFAFGWHVIGCPPAGERWPGVNPMRVAHMLDTVRSLRSRDETSPVVYVLHWNYELERWPQPAHRQLAFMLIDAGVDAVIGMHSHLPQGAELHKGKPVAYGLGNFWLPPRQVGNLWMDHGPEALRSIALGLTFDGRGLRACRFHWTAAEPDAGRISLAETESIEDDGVRGLTPFEGLGHAAYVKWFKANRVQRRLLPIYKDCRSRWKTALCDRWLVLRHRLLHGLVRLGVKRKLRARESS